MTVTAQPLGGFLRVPGLVWAAVDDRGVVRRCSPGIQDVLGRSPDSVVGRRALVLLHRADLPVAAAAAARVMAGDEVTGVTLRLRHADGSWRLLRCSARRGAAGHVSLVARDVTAEHDSRGEAEAHEALLRGLLDHMPMPVFVKDAAGRYSFANHEFCRLAGVSNPEDLVDRQAEDLWPEAVGDIARHEIELAESDGDANGCEEHLSTVDGERDFIVARRVVRDDDGRPHAIAGVSIDITDRVRAEQRLAERGRVLDAILATSPDVIAVLDRRGRVVRHNATSNGMLGHRLHQVLVPDVLSLVHPDDVDDLTAAYADLLSGATEDVVARCRLRHQDGHWVTVDSRARVERDDDGRVVGMVAVTRDVTADLASETRLRGAVAAAEEASRAKSELLSRMSHELRTPLNSVLGFAQLLQMDDLPPAQADDVAGIVRAGRRLLAVIDEVLDIARIETGHLELRPEPVPAARALAAAAGPGDTVSVTPDLPPLWVDPERLAQVLDTLHRLARREPGGNGRVVLSAEGGTPGAVRLVVSAGPTPPDGPTPPGGPDAGVAAGPPVPVDGDAGPPVPVDGDAGPPVPVDGDVEITLALARYLVEQMGGSMEPLGDTGSGFEVVMPAHVTGERSPVAPNGASSSLRLVVVTAEPTVGELVAQVAARRPGVEVLALPDTEATVASVVAGMDLPSVVLVDTGRRLPAQSPVVQGVRQLAADRRPVLAILGADGSGTPTALLAGVADAYLAAPLDVRSVLELIDAVRDMGPPA